MISTSKYVQINDFLLLEYQYEGSERLSSDVKTWKIENHITNTYQFVNDNNAKGLTNNILDWSSSVFDKSLNKWVSHNIDGSNLINTDKYTLTEITDIYSVKYDKIKVHILSGFVFEDIDGLIFEVIFKENSNKDFNPAIFTYLKNESQQINYNEVPLLIGERNYDRYIEFEVPSLYFAQYEYWPVANLDESQQDHTFEYNYSYPVQGNTKPGGYKKNSLIYVNVYEISDTIVEDNITYFKTNRDFKVSFNDSDNYSLLSAIIKESDEGEYFEYYATWGGEFIDDYIRNLNSSTNGDWGIINQIEIYEQVGTRNILTSNRTELQNDEFDSPNILRPIILNSEIAFSFSIDYTMRLYNKLSGEQIIRKASLTSYEPKKYGKNLLKLKVNEGFRPIKVYNKLNEKLIVNVNEDIPVTTFETKYISNFIQNYNISVNINSKFGKDLNDTIFGQGEGIIFLNLFDNVIRFKILKESLDKEEKLPLNLSNAKIYLVFILNDETKSRISNDVVEDVLSVNGEFQFTIDSKLSTKILKSKKNNFYIVSKDDDNGKETLVYQGKFYDFNDYNLIIKELFATNDEPQIATNDEPQIAIKEPIIGINTKIKPENYTTKSVKKILDDPTLTRKEKEVILNKRKVNTKKTSFFTKLKPAVTENSKTTTSRKINISEK